MKFVRGEVIGREGCPYMQRWVLDLGVCTLRLHHFLRSDDDAALHDHPWWFITFPLGTYREWREYAPIKGVRTTGKVLRVVKGWRPHFRPAHYRHAVVIDRPLWTLVLTGRRKRDWGFWWKGRFWPWRKWINVFGDPPCADERTKP